MKAVVVILFVAYAYLAASLTAFRIANPEFTETQMLMHIPDALMWKKGKDHGHR